MSAPSPRELAALSPGAQLTEDELASVDKFMEEFRKRMPASYNGLDTLFNLMERPAVVSEICRRFWVAGWLVQWDCVKPAERDPQTNVPILGSQPIVQVALRPDWSRGG